MISLVCRITFRQGGRGAPPLQTNITVTIKSVGATIGRPRAIRESPLQAEHKTPHKTVGVVRLYLLRKLTTLLCGVNFFILRTTHPSAFGCHLPSQGKALCNIAPNKAGGEPPPLQAMILW